MNDKKTKFFDCWQDAIKYALSQYWVQPISCNDEKNDSIFNRKARAVDWSESGLIHFEPKSE